MSEHVTAIDIKNWRRYYESRSYDEMIGLDFFVISCMDTIDDLRAELHATVAAGLRDASLAVAMYAENQQLQAQLRTVEAELATARHRIAELEAQLNVANHLVRTNNLRGYPS